MKRMLPVWFWVGLVLTIYGLIMLAVGIYHLFHPPSTSLSHLHPNLLWGGVMLVVGLVFIIPNAKGKG